MSTAAMAVDTPKSHKSKKSKDRSDKSSSKKRRRDDDNAAEPQSIPSAAHDDQAAEPLSTPSKPSKKRRTQSPSAPVSTSLKTTDSKHPSPFVHSTASLLLPLAPQAFAYPLQGLCAEHLSPLLLTYHPPFDGILLSYSSPRLSSSASPAPPYLPPPSPGSSSPEISVLARVTDEYAPPFAWLTADILLLRPAPGASLTGIVQVQNPSWLGLVCWNYFNAGIPAARLPKGWTWVDDAEDNAPGENGVEGGHWIDEDGNAVQGELEFRLKKFESAPATETGKGFVSLEGTLLSDEEDAEVDKVQREAGTKTKGKTARL